MVEKVITLGRTTVTAVLRGTQAETAPIGGDFREIKFHCRFPADAVNSGTFHPAAPKPHIRVLVHTTAPEYVYRVEIVPPGGNQEVLRTQRRQRGGVSWARPATMVAGERQVAPRPTSRTIGTTTWELDDPFGDIDDVYDPIDPGGPIGGGGSGPKRYIRALDPAMDEEGWWTVRVRNLNQDEERFVIVIDHPETVQRLVETPIPYRLINRAFAQALLTMQLSIHIDNGQARIEFDPTFRDLTGIETQFVSVDDRLNDINLQEFKVTIGNEEGGPTITIGLDLEERGEEFVVGPIEIDIENLAIVVRIHIGFGYQKGDFFETAMRRENDQVVRKSVSLNTYLDMNPEIDSLWADVADLWAKVHGPSVAERIQNAIDAAGQALYYAVKRAETYVQDVIMHLVDRREVMFAIRSDDDNMIVQHHHRPGPRDFLDDDAVAPGDGTILDTETEGPPLDALARNSLFLTETLGEGPVRPAQGKSRAIKRQREGEIDHIVILMMENRSFDHMLGYRRFAHPETNGLTGNESNPFSQGASHRVFHLSETAGIRCPNHGHEATLEQIADGTMSGFVENYAKRRGVSNPGRVMSYYDARELPMYEFLANNFAICDAWHSAHPGETQCNRFAALTGIIPSLNNFDLSDPRLAYYMGHTILDYLTDQGIDWVYAEGNIGFLRMFDRYRIDVSHVIPYRTDQEEYSGESFVDRVTSGNLPSVSFIDPSFIDIPPAWDANDDLPPADVRRGQQLVAHVYSLLSTANT